MILPEPCICLPDYQILLNLIALSHTRLFWLFNTLNGALRAPRPAHGASLILSVSAKLIILGIRHQKPREKSLRSSKKSSLLSLSKQSPQLGAGPS
jgi:hypothetical protein